jgi:4-hydroxybenzoate polyprenyltransferase
MHFSKYVDEKTKREYFQHSHLIYLSTFFAFFAIIPFSFIKKHSDSASLCDEGITAIAVLINRRGYYGLASFIFILTITIQAAAESSFWT